MTPGVFPQYISSNRLCILISFLISISSTTFRKCDVPSCTGWSYPCHFTPQADLPSMLPYRSMIFSLHPLAACHELECGLWRAFVVRLTSVLYCFCAIRLRTILALHITRWDASVHSIPPIFSPITSVTYQVRVNLTPPNPACYFYDVPEKRYRDGCPRF